MVHFSSENSGAWISWDSYKKTENRNVIDPNIAAYLHYHFEQLEPNPTPFHTFFDASSLGVTYLSIQGDCIELSLDCLYADSEEGTPPEEMISILQHAVIFRKCLHAISKEYVFSYEHDVQDGSLYAHARRHIAFRHLEDELEKIRDLLTLALTREQE